MQKISDKCRSSGITSSLVHVISFVRSVSTQHNTTYLVTDAVYFVVNRITNIFFNYVDHVLLPHMIEYVLNVLVLVLNLFGSIRSHCLDLNSGDSC
jgi:hypothetical protein